MNSPAAFEVRRLRREFRQRRRALDSTTRRVAGRRLAAAAARSVLRWRVRHIACFLAADGEIDTTTLLARLAGAGRQLWLPCVAAARLRFRAYTPGAALCRGPFGLLQPATGVYRAPRLLDLVLLPLVAFDASGTRLGMGGGFYDRTFAFRRQRRHWRRPLLIGVAFALQQADALPRRHWDVPLDGVLTEQGLRLFRPRSP